MSEQDHDVAEDLEPTAEDESQVVGGATPISDFHITKPVDKPTP